MKYTLAVCLLLGITMAVSTKAPEQPVYGEEDDTYGDDGYGDDGYGDDTYGDDGYGDDGYGDDGYGDDGYGDDGYGAGDYDYDYKIYQPACNCKALKKRIRDLAERNFRLK